MLRLVSNNEWVMLSLAATCGIEAYHKAYSKNMHGIVYIDEKGGNSVLIDNNEVVNIREAINTNNFATLQSICDDLHRNCKISVII